MKLLIYFTLNIVVVPGLFVLLGLALAMLLPQRDPIRSAKNKVKVGWASVLSATVIVLVICAVLWGLGEMLPVDKLWGISRILLYSSVTLFLSWVIPCSSYLYLSGRKQRKALKGQASIRNPTGKVEHYLITLPGYFIIVSVMGLLGYFFYF
ncbi:hypothetical protein R9C00_23815 [Flammeovirgaceae bacterium SG7u.111]|nr:hypothetical protein [Flammeovirgaceae bacterium SG7u.132]WPO34729.1 hypothetical protein R9C00_23815 [Flammeovirgaceae bacterium SG7u.111]